MIERITACEPNYSKFMHGKDLLKLNVSLLAKNEVKLLNLGSKTIHNRNFNQWFFDKCDEWNSKLKWKRVYYYKKYSNQKIIDSLKD